MAQRTKRARQWKSNNNFSKIMKQKEKKFYESFNA
jgi:hypothetical protein